MNVQEAQNILSKVPNEAMGHFYNFALLLLNDPEAARAENDRLEREFKRLDADPSLSPVERKQAKRQIIENS